MRGFYEECWRLSCGLGRRHTHTELSKTHWQNISSSARAGVMLETTVNPCTLYNLLSLVLCPACYHATRTGCLMLEFVDVAGHLVHISAMVLSQSCCILDRSRTVRNHDYPFPWHFTLPLSRPNHNASYKSCIITKPHETTVDKSDGGRENLASLSYWQWPPGTATNVAPRTEHFECVLQHWGCAGSVQIQLFGECIRLVHLWYWKILNGELSNTLGRHHSQTDPWVVWKACWFKQVSRILVGRMILTSRINADTDLQCMGSEVSH